ncbi:MAG: HAMP domain-containing histidine kinase [Lewinellaceae bacterium]|nr:HAMP domain-containing histidine kinase [Saprospiraceae bacterium]MCB9312731.1 HAMP domain-containing histidine kinase [Lewinellaceae bacterium]HRW74622.1 HAMP domain-containing sensor histidine kinase [Saprospiraceae bacterium]
MDIYRLKSMWKWGLALAGLLVVGLSLLVIRQVVQQIRDFEHQKIVWFKTAVEDLPNNPDNASFILHDAILTADLRVPLILVNERGIIEDARNFGSELDSSKQFLAGRLAVIQANGYPPVELADGKKIYYEDSRLVAYLNYLPFIQIALVSLLIFLGYLGFNVSRRAEENRVWVGMARETAHQLGTPLTAILAWVEYLRTHAQGNPQINFAADEIARDADKLELIADRFSKIGSTAELTPHNLLTSLDRTRSYMQARAPKRIRFDFPDPESPPIMVMINMHLFEWVIENLLRNALDAMEGEGEIKATARQEGRWVHIEISDTGKGIPSSRFRRVFKPGYTTKSRGWGLGLSLAKRIVESYHKGRIYVKSSTLGKGTTFAILLPVPKG